MAEMRDIFYFYLVAVFLLFFTRTHSKELQSNDSTSTCKVGKVKVISLQTEVSFKELVLFNGELVTCILDEIHRYRKYY